MDKFTVADIPAFERGEIAVNCASEELAKEFFDYFKVEFYKMESYKDRVLYYYKRDFSIVADITWTSIGAAILPIKQFCGWDKEETKVDKLQELEAKMQEIQQEIEALKQQQQPQRKTGYEKPEHYQECYWVHSCCSVTADRWTNEALDNRRYNEANIFTDKALAEREAFETSLWRRIKRWRAENDGVVLYNWKDNSNKWFIEYDYTDKKLYADYIKPVRLAFQVYFSIQSIAQQCIDTFRTDLLKYFGVESEG